MYKKKVYNADMFSIHGAEKMLYIVMAVGVMGYCSYKVAS